MDRVAVRVGEHEPVVAIGTAPDELLALLSDAMCQQRAHRCCAEIDTASISAVGLGRADREAPVLVSARGALVLLAVELDDLLPNDQESLVEVHVGPPQAGC